MSIKSEIKKKLLRYKYLKRVNSYKKKEINSIAVVFYIPESNKSKYNNWVDGFTKAVDLLGEEYNITWVNLAVNKPESKDLNKFDFLIVKSCWDWIVDNYVQGLKGLNVPTGLAISCSRLPLNTKSIYFYDVLWYETNWYNQFVSKHPRAFHAFGINSEVFKDKKSTKEFDVLSIGQLASYKRHEKILNLKGDRKIVIGDTNTDEGEKIRTLLEENNVEVVNFMNQDSLSDFINKSKLVYVPAILNGGGERAVLEARSCNVEVLIEKDNPKLEELLTSEIWDEKYYSDSLKKGIISILK